MMARHVGDAHERDDGPDAASVDEGDRSPLQRLIRDRLRERHWSYGDVAKRGGLPRSTVYNLATTAMRARPPKPQTLERLAAGLELPLSAVRAAAAESAGFHYYRESQVDAETAVLMASLEELGPEDRRHVAALIESLRRGSQR